MCIFKSRLVHAFTAAVPSQQFSDFAEMGVIGKAYMDKGKCKMHCYTFLQE